MGQFIAVNYRECTGCQTCQLVCSLYHTGECNPRKAAIRVIRREREGRVFCLPLICQQCRPALCVDACPSGALSRDEAKGVLIFHRDRCTFCGLCGAACSIGCLSFNEGESPFLCDLCGGQPRCVQACHTHCLSEVGDRLTVGEKDTDYLIRVVEQEHLAEFLPGESIV